MKSMMTRLFKRWKNDALKMKTTVKWKSCIVKKSSLELTNSNENLSG